MTRALILWACEVERGSYVVKNKRGQEKVAPRENQHKHKRIFHCAGGGGVVQDSSFAPPPPGCYRHRRRTEVGVTAGAAGGRGKQGNGLDLDTVTTALRATGQPP